MPERGDKGEPGNRGTFPGAFRSLARYAITKSKILSLFTHARGRERLRRVTKVCEPENMTGELFPGSPVVC